MPMSIRSSAVSVLFGAKIQSDLWIGMEGRIKDITTFSFLILMAAVQDKSTISRYFFVFFPWNSQASKILFGTPRKVMMSCMSFLETTGDIRTVRIVEVILVGVRFARSIWELELDRFMVCHWIRNPDVSLDWVCSGTCFVLPATIVSIGCSSIYGESNLLFSIEFEVRTTDVAGFPIMVWVIHTHSHPHWA